MGCLASRKPARSARTDPSVMKTILGFPAAKEAAESVKMNEAKLRKLDRNMVWIKRV